MLLEKLSRFVLKLSRRFYKGNLNIPFCVEIIPFYLATHIDAYMCLHLITTSAAAAGATGRATTMSLPWIRDRQVAKLDPRPPSR